MSTWRESEAAYKRLREFIGNLGTCSARPWRSCSRPDGSPIIAWLDTYTPPTTVQRCDGSAP